MRPCVLGRIRTFAAVLLLALAGMSVPSRGAAQATRADSAAVLLHAAEAFEAEGRWEVAEAVYEFILERFGNTPAATQARTALEGTPQGGPNRSSQVELMVWSTTYGAWLGVAIPGALGAGDAGAYGAGLLLGGPAGFLAGRALSRSRPLSEGQVRAITFGSLWGTWQGYALMEIVGWGEKECCDLDFCYVEDPSGEAVLTSLIVGGLAGTVGGALLARKPISNGVATTANLGALWGTWFGLAGGVLADLEGDGLLTSTVLLGNAGLIGAAMSAPNWNMSRNRARLVSIAGVIGGLAGAGLDLIIQPDDEKVAVGIPLVGSIAGLVIGARLTSDTNRNVSSSASSLSHTHESLGGRSSLLHLSDGRLGFGMPTPFPTLVPFEGPWGFSYRPALGFTLFDSRF